MKAPAFNWDRCCHLVLYLQLILFYFNHFCDFRGFWFHNYVLISNYLGTLSRFGNFWHIIQKQKVKKLILQLLTGKQACFEKL